MRHTFVADTHGLTRHLRISTDILHICGDVMNSGYDVQELIDFVEWLSKQKYERCIFTPGNHDRLFQNDEDLARSIVEPYATVLIDQYTHVDGLKVYGSPWTSEFNNWGFGLPRGSEELTKKWKDVPKDTDILLTHGPPINIMDNRLGDYRLCVEVLTRIKPKIHAFGHIHETYGVALESGVLFINCSICNGAYEPVNMPFTIDL